MCAILEVLVCSKKNSAYCIEIVIVIFWVSKHGGDVSCLLVPVSVVIVGHDRNPVQVLSNHGDNISERKEIGFDSMHWSHHEGRTNACPYCIYIPFINNKLAG